MASTRDKLGRASWTLQESIQDSVTSTVAHLIHDGKLKLDQNQARFLQDILIKSVEAGYHKAYDSFMKTVDIALDDEPVKKNKKKSNA